MEKNKELRDIAPLTFPKIRPENGVGMYLLSKIYEKEPKCFPHWDIARESIILDWIVAKRHLYQATKRLHDKRQLLIKKREFFNEQYKELAVKEAAFQISFRKFNKFVRENQEKRDRAEKKIVDEKALQIKRDNDIADVKNNIAYLIEIKSQMDTKIKEFRMYDDYLQGVTKQTTMFKSLSDIIIRYEALVEAKEFLGERQNKELASLENARADMARLLEEKNLVLIGLSNQLTELQARYDIGKTTSLMWETLVSQIQDISARKLDEIHAVKVACWNTYKTMCTRKGIEANLPPDDIEAQLLMVKRTMAELTKVYHAAEKEHSSEGRSMKVEVDSRKTDSRKTSSRVTK